jgi:hypothetical protein
LDGQFVLAFLRIGQGGMPIFVARVQFGPIFQQKFQDFHMPFPSSPVHRCRPESVARIGIGPVQEQKASDAQIALGGGFMQRGSACFVSGIHRRSLG